MSDKLKQLKELYRQAEELRNNMKFECEDVKFEIFMTDYVTFSLTTAHNGMMGVSGQLKIETIHKLSAWLKELEGLKP